MSSGREMRSGVGDLDGDPALRVVIVSEVNPPESADAQKFDDEVATDPFGHCCRRIAFG